MFGARHDPTWRTPKAPSLSSLVVFIHALVALGRVLITFFITACDDQSVFYHAILLSWIAASSVNIFFQNFAGTKCWRMGWICSEQNFIKGSARLQIGDQLMEYLYFWATLYMSTFTYTPSTYIHNKMSNLLLYRSQYEQLRWSTIFWSGFRWWENTAELKIWQWVAAPRISSLLPLCACDFIKKSRTTIWFHNGGGNVDFIKMKSLSAKAQRIH